MNFSIETYHGSYNIVKRSTPVKYIVVHYTGSGTSAAGSARANCVYFSGGNRNASAHYFIDDGHIFEYADPQKYACWHVGDGKGKYGITNANSIGIEICNSGGAFTASEINRLTWLVKDLMNRFKVDSAHVVRHYDASRKLCPMYYAKNQNAWNTLHAHITNGINGDDEEVTDADIDKIVNKIITYKVAQMNGDKDFYQLITDIHWQVCDEKSTLLDRIKNVTLAYKNKKMNGNKDFYQLITDIHNKICG